MKEKRVYVAICYDFDGTLSPGNMQEYGFLPGLGDAAKTFWSESNNLAKNEHADPILTYMLYMLEKAAQEKIGTKKEDFIEYGRKVELFPGVKKWFPWINKYGEKKGLCIEHYIVSSGLREMIEGSPIGEEFERIYACQYMYDHNKAAKWPAISVNYTTKTQFIFRINKGITDDSDNKKINKYIPEEKRRIPFSKIVYIGDGETDVPCMKLVKDKGGHSISVYDKSNPKKEKESHALLKDKRVNYIADADYNKNSRLCRLVCAILDKIVATEQLKTIENEEIVSLSMSDAAVVDHESATGYDHTETVNPNAPTTSQT